MRKWPVLAAGVAIWFGAQHSAVFHGAPDTVAVHTVPASANKALADRLAASLYGWTGTQKACLNDLWWQESGFSQYADTRVTGAGGDGPGSAVFAYGIAQARPASKYPKAGQPASMGGGSDPGTQVTWGLWDIKTVYGLPCGAWRHELGNGWY